MALVVGLFAFLAHNAAGALARRNIAIDFSFLRTTAGFDIPFKLAEWDSSDSYGYALVIAGLNTALASVLAIGLATLLGLVLALMRLSANPLARGVSRGAVELVRNTPQLLLVVFWYFAVLQTLPGTRASLSAFGSVFLNVRGLFFPALAFDGPVLAGLGVVVALWVALWAVRRRAGRMPAWVAVAVAAVLALLLADASWSVPALRGFNFAGGWRLPPELLALVLGVGLYTSGFVAENTRASIAAVSHGQAEAARSLGLSPARTMRLVILPQALRTLLPPLTSQYLNVIKSTTLGAAVAYPEILQVYARTVLNQSGRAVEVMALVLGVFLSVNLGVSAAMHRWERRLARQFR